MARRTSASDASQPTRRDAYPGARCCTRLTSVARAASCSTCRRSTCKLANKQTSKETRVYAPARRKISAQPQQKVVSRRTNDTPHAPRP